jgi:hypothetical protein
MVVQRDGYFLTTDIITAFAQMEQKKKKTGKNLKHGSWCPGEESTQLHLQCESAALILEPTQEHLLT